MAQFGVVVVVILLACQTWSSLAYNNQRTEWVVEHSRTGKLDGEPAKSVIDRKRHLSEAQIQNSSTGWRARLVHDHHWDPTLLNLSGMERIKREAKRSVARSIHLDSKVKRAIANREGRSVLSDSARKILQTESVEADVFSTSGGYSMTFSLGTPPQQVIAIADTGSDLVWVQCATCTQCFTQPTALFDPTVSTTYSTLNCADTACTNLGSNMLACTPSCTYNYEYGDQSMTSGNFVSDVFSLNTTTDTAIEIPNFSFGCGTANSGTFSETDGIVGLGRGPISFPSQIAASINESRMFSYCLQNFYSESSSPIVFGDAAQNANFSAANSTPIQTPFDLSEVPFYYVNLTSIAVGGVDLAIPSSAFEIDSQGNGGTVFDSGTTYTTLTPVIYQAVMSAFQSNITYTPVDLSEETGLEYCYDITGVSQFSVPSLTFVYATDAEFDLPRDNYVAQFVGQDSSSQYACIALLQSSSELNIFGNTQQQNFQLLYDQVLLQISWLPVADCTTL